MSVLRTDKEVAHKEENVRPSGVSLVPLGSDDDDDDEDDFCSAAPPPRAPCD
jgi:hypothetical protein